MSKDIIAVRDTIVHILDSTVGMPVLSDDRLDFGSDFGDFLREHIYRVLKSDDVKKCKFDEDSNVYNIIQTALDTGEDFVEMSKKIAGLLYEIMNGNINIPSADLIISCFEIENISFIAFLKMNYNEAYMHQTVYNEGNNVNSIIKYKASLPSKTQKLTEAAIINLGDFSLNIIEKKYEVNGEKVNYFSERFLKCKTNLSQKAKLAIVEKAVDSVQKEYFNESEQFEEKMKAKSVIHDELAQANSVSVEDVMTRVFEDKVELKEKFKEKLGKYHINEEEVIKPQNDSTTKKYEKQYLKTDTGIEIKIPMEQYNSSDKIEFITNEDGTISVIIKNIGHITSK